MCVCIHPFYSWVFFTDSKQMAFGFVFLFFGEFLWKTDFFSAFKESKMKVDNKNEHNSTTNNLNDEKNVLKFDANNSISIDIFFPNSNKEKKCVYLLYPMCAFLFKFQIHSFFFYCWRKKNSSYRIIWLENAVQISIEQ